MRISDWSSDVCSSDLFCCRRISGRMAMTTVNPQVTDIIDVVQVYFDGLYAGDTAKLRQAFHPASSLFASADGQLVQVPREDRSEERRVGKECVSTCRSRGARYK